MQLFFREEMTTLLLLLFNCLITVIGFPTSEYRMSHYLPLQLNITSFVSRDISYAYDMSSRL